MARKGEECVFCKLAAGLIPAQRIYDDEDVIAFLDIAPANKGHVLVMPKKHYETFLDIPADELSKVMGVAQRIAGGVIKAMNADSFNLLLNDGRTAGRLVDHTHIHIIPRFSGDGVTAFTWAKKDYAEGDMKDTASRIVKAIR